MSLAPSLNLYWGGGTTFVAHQDLTHGVLDELTAGTEVAIGYQRINFSDNLSIKAGAHRR